MKIKLWMVAVIVFVVIFGGIGLTMLTGAWSTESDKIPSLYTTGEFAGEYNPEDIRGSYTFQDVADTFQIGLAVLFDAFGIPADTDGTAIKTKDIEATYGDAEIGNGSVQLFVALYKGLPIALEDTFLTPRAAELILANNPNLTDGEKAYMESHTADPGLAEEEADEAETPPATETAHAEGEEAAVKGTTTFRQLLDAGLTQEQIEQIIGGAMPAANMLVRDYCTANGLSFSTVKTQLTDALDGAQ